MDLKDKIKNSGIESVKNKLNNLKNRLEKQKRPEKLSKLKNSIEGALSTGKIQISKKTKDLINPDLKISNNKLKSFKTPSNEAESKKFKKETDKALSKSDIGKIGLGVKQDLKDRVKDFSSKMLGEDISGKILKKKANPASVEKDGSAGTEDVINKGKGISKTRSEMSNPLTVQKMKNYENKPLYKDIRESPKDPGIKFKIVATKSPETEEMKKLENKIKGGTQRIPGIRKEIILPIFENDLSSSYGFDYEGAEKTIFGGQDKGFFDSTAALKGLGQAFKQIPGIGNYAETAGNKLLQAASVAINPNLEQIFKSVSFRDFNLNFLLVAKTKDDAEDYQQIIKMFKYWSHPSSAMYNNSPILHYPDLWSIEYIVPNYNIGTENVRPSQGGVIYGTKIAYCTKIDVTYSTGDYLLLENNEPAVIKLSLSFKEKNLLTREDIYGGL